MAGEGAGDTAGGDVVAVELKTRVSGTRADGGAGAPGGAVAASGARGACRAGAVGGAGAAASGNLKVTRRFGLPA